MSKVADLQPQAIWKNFANINAIPRASKKEDRIIDFMIQYGQSLGLETTKDAVGNVLIKKPASKGYENRKTVVLQSHLDMVHQKNSITDFDFDTQGIDMHIDGDWVKAKDTTLGADNGIGVAAIMGILASTDIDHPAIEALFTIDEETGMTGALSLQPGFLTGSILLNLDTEDDNEIDIGCAGGIDVTATKHYSKIACPVIHSGIKLSVKGLHGGHSGMDIHKGLGNANKIMNRILYQICPELGVMVSTIDGGSLRNAIPRESIATLSIHPELKVRFAELFNKIKSEIVEEYKALEPNITIEYEELLTPHAAMDPVEEMRMLKAIYAATNGVFRMSPEIADLVEASNNVARVEVKDGTIKVLCLTRSSVESSKQDVVNSLTAAFELAGFEVETSGSYPGWSPNIHSEILAVATKVYEKLNGEKPHVIACHAGLECGIIGGPYPHMDMISFGPTIKGAHSPDEKANIPSVAKFWEYLLEVLKEIPLK